MKENKPKTNPVKAIRAHCLDCCCGSSEEVKKCPVHYCPLYPFRFGKNPYHKPKLTEEQRAIRSEKMKILRAKQLSKKNNSAN